MATNRAKPPAGATLNRAHPLARALVFALPFNEGGGAVANDLAGSRRGVITAPAWATGPYGGPALRLNGTATFVGSLGAPAIAAPNYTFAARARLSAAGSFPTTIGVSGNFSELRFSAGTRKPEWFANGATPDALSAVAVPLGAWVDLVGVATAWGVSLYVNGIPAASTAGATTNSLPAGIEVGRRFGGADLFAGDIDFAAAWSRALSAQEVALLYADPYGMMNPPPRLSTWWLKNVLASVSDSAGVTDGATGASAYARAVADPEGVTDAMARVAAYVRSQSDPGGVTDSASRAAVYARSLSDAEGVSDSAAFAAAYARALVDPVGVTDAASRVVAYLRTQSDAAGVADAVVRLVAYARGQSDDAGVSDAMASVAAYVRTRADAEGVTDAIVQSLVPLLVLSATLSSPGPELSGTISVVN